MTEPLQDAKVRELVVTGMSLTGALDAVLITQEIATTEATTEAGSDVVFVTDEVRMAGELTQRIRHAAENLWDLLLEAYERKVWGLLGYPSWKAYVAGEFDMHLSRSYQLLDAARIQHELRNAVTPPPQSLSTVVESPASSVPVRITESQARKIKRRVPDVVHRIQGHLSRGKAPQEAVDEAIRESGGKAPTKTQTARIVTILDGRDRIAANHKSYAISTLAAESHLTAVHIVKILRARRGPYDTELAAKIATARAWLAEFEAAWNGGAS